MTGYGRVETIQQGRNIIVEVKELLAAAYTRWEELEQLKNEL